MNNNKNNPLIMIVAEARTGIIVASTARILGIRSLQELERKGIVNKGSIFTIWLEIAVAIFFFPL